MRRSIANLMTAWRLHWPEYLMEGAELGLFMVSASIFAMVLFHPSSVVHHAIDELWVRRLLMGAAMGATAIAIIYCPLGRRSGAHMNPAVSLAFLRLGKIAPADACWYIVHQSLGGSAAMILMSVLAGASLADPAVRFVATVPPSTGASALVIAWAAEFAMSFILLMTVLCTSNRRALAPFAGVFAGLLVSAYIFVEDPLSGMSINPARTFASSIVSRIWTAWWIYLTAPPLAMLLAAQVYVWIAGVKKVYCAKFFHDTTSRCIFQCRFHELERESSPAVESAERHAASSSQPSPSCVTG